MRKDIKIWSDSTWGAKGVELWLPLVGYPFLVFILGLLLFLFVDSDFSGATTGFVFSTINILAMLYIVSLASVALYRVRVQIVEISLLENGIVLSCYFNNKKELNGKQLFSLERIDVSKLYLHFSYLSSDSPNYCLTTKNGQKFYISGDMPEVDSLIQVLHKIIDKNKEL